MKARSVSLDCGSDSGNIVTLFDEKICHVVIKFVMFDDEAASPEKVVERFFHRQA